MVTEVIFPTGIPNGTPVSNDRIMFSDTSDTNTTKDCEISALPISTETSSAIAVVQSDINTHEALTNNPHSVTATQVGLGNVDNTSDANKPISTDTQTALDTKQPDIQFKDEGVNKGTSGGVSTINFTGNIVTATESGGILTVDISGPGTGDVVGPASATDSNFAAFDTTTGKLIKDSGSKASDFAPALTSDENYVTDAEKIVIGNTSGINNGDQPEIYDAIVAPTGGDYTSIRTAVLAGNKNIYVKAGIYQETDTIYLTTEGINITGENRETVIIRPAINKSGIKAYSNYAYVRNLTIDTLTNGGADCFGISDGSTPGTPDFTKGNFNTLDNCRLIGPNTYGAFTLYCSGGSLPTGGAISYFEALTMAQGNVIKNCIIEGSQAGDVAVFALQKNGRFENNLIKYGRIAFYMTRNSSCSFNLSEDSVAEGIFIAGPSRDNEINNNIIYNPGTTGIKTQNQLENTAIYPTYSTMNNTINGNVVYNAGNQGYSLEEADGNSLMGNISDVAGNHNLYLQEAKNNNIVGFTGINPRTNTGNARGSGIYMVSLVKDNSFSDIYIDDSRATPLMHTAIGNREGTDCTGNKFNNVNVKGQNSERTIWIQSNDWSLNNIYAEGGNYAGIRLDGASYCKLDNLHLKNNCKQSNNSYAELWLQNGASNNIIGKVKTESTVSNKAKYGIQVDSGCNTNLFLYHKDVGAVTSAKLDSGTSNEFLSGTNSGDNATNTQYSGLATSKANAALDNLGTTAINTSLVSDTDNTDDLGTTLKKWANLFVTTIGATATRVTNGWFTTTNSNAINIDGTAGAGFATFLAQSANPSTPPAGTAIIFAKATAGGLARLEMLTSSGAELAFFRDIVTTIRNETGSTITKGQLVYINGSNGTVSTASLAKADSATTSADIGFAIADISNNSFGTIQRAGLLTGVDTSSFTAGDTLWLSATTAGAFINTEPAAPNFGMKVGFVVFSSVGAGIIDIFLQPFVASKNYGSFGTLNSPSMTASEIIATDASKNLVSLPVATYPSLVELAYVKGVTSAIQTQLNAKGTGNGDMILASVQSVTGLKTFDTTKLAIKGSSTGTTAIASANASATDYTATLPAKDFTYAGLDDATGGNTTQNIGYLNIPQNSQSAAYTTVLADSGKHIYHPSADTTARIWTIDSNANVAYPIGTAITFINDTSGGVITISITSDTLVLAGAGTTGSRTLAANGTATAIKATSTRWIISGVNLT